MNRLAIIVAGGAALAIAILIWLMVHDSNLKKEVKERERLEQVGATLDRVEKANDIRNETLDPYNPSIYEQCLRASRTPENCERFLPRGQGDKGQPGPDR